MVEDKGNRSFVSRENENIWLGDTASQSHIVRDRSLFTDYVDTPTGEITGAGSCPSPGRGTVKVQLITTRGTIPLTLNNVLHAPKMPYNLLSL